MFFQKYIKDFLRTVFCAMIVRGQFKNAVFQDQRVILFDQTIERGIVHGHTSIHDRQDHIFTQLYFFTYSLSIYFFNFTGS